MAALRVGLLTVTRDEMETSSVTGALLPDGAALGHATQKWRAFEATHTIIQSRVPGRLGEPRAGLNGRICICDIDKVAYAVTVDVATT